MVSNAMKAKVFMLYPGAKVSYSYILGDQTRYGEDTLTGVYKETEEDVWVLQVRAWNDSLSSIDIEENQARLILKDLSGITDEDCIEVARLLQEGVKYKQYKYEFNRIDRLKWDISDGTDAEESISIYMKAIPTNESFRKAGWTDREFMFKLVAFDRYNQLPYFTVLSREPGSTVWANWGSTNHLGAFDYLRSNSYMFPAYGIQDLFTEGIAIKEKEDGV